MILDRNIYTDEGIKRNEKDFRRQDMYVSAMKVIDADIREISLLDETIEYLNKKGITTVRQLINNTYDENGNLILEIWFNELTKIDKFVIDNGLVYKNDIRYLTKIKDYQDISIDGLFIYGYLIDKLHKDCKIDNLAQLKEMVEGYEKDEYLMKIHYPFYRRNMRLSSDFILSLLFSGMELESNYIQRYCDYVEKKVDSYNKK